MTNGADTNLIACPQCKEANPVTARFCRACGAALVSDPDAHTPTQPLSPPYTGRLPLGEIVSGIDGADFYVITSSDDSPSPRSYQADSLVTGSRVLLYEAIGNDELAGLRTLCASETSIPFVATTEPAFTNNWFGSERHYVPEVLPIGNVDTPRTIDEWIEIARQLVQAIAALHESAGVAFDLTSEACPHHIAIQRGVAQWHMLCDLVTLKEKPDAAVSDMRALAGYLRRPLASAPVLCVHLDAAAQGNMPAIELSRLLGAPKRPFTQEDSLSNLHIDIGTATDKGLQREINEDSLGIASAGDPEHVARLLIVADGMGGEEAGEVASDMAVKLLTQAFTTNRGWNGSQLNVWLQRAIRQMSDDVLQEARQRRNQMGATLVVAVIYANKAYLANVGDSRIYRWSAERDHGQLTRMTRDHSLVQRLVDMGQITDEQRYSHPDRNMVLRSIGDPRAGYSDLIQPVVIQTGDWLLLCSDGLWEMVRDSRIQDILAKAASAQDACDKLIAEANMNGGEDNITAIAARFSDK